MSCNHRSTVDGRLLVEKVEDVEGSFNLFQCQVCRTKSEYRVLEREWIMQLEQGDRVVEYDSHGYSSRYILRKVVKVTPTGIVRVDNNNSFDSSGVERIKSNVWTRKSRIIPINDAVLDVMYRENAIKYPHKVVFDENLMKKFSTSFLRSMRESVEVELNGNKSSKEE